MHLSQVCTFSHISSEYFGELHRGNPSAGDGLMGAMAIFSTTVSERGKN